MTERSNTSPDPYMIETAERESKVISLINQVDEYVRRILAEELRSCQMVEGVRSTMHAGDNDAARYGESMNLKNMASQRYVELVTRGRTLLVHALVVLNKDINLWRLQPLSELHSTSSIRFRRQRYRIILKMLRNACRSSLSSSRDEWEEIMEEVKLADNGGYPKEPFIVNELENYFDPDIYMTQRVRRDSRITENKWRGVIAAKMKIMIDEYKVRRQGLELFVTQIDELYACWYPKKGKNSSYYQANGDAWDSSSEDDSIAARVGQFLPALLGYQQINQHPQPSSSASQTGTKHGNHSVSSDSTIHDTETSSKNTKVKKRKRSTSISKTGDASTEREPTRRSGENVSTSSVDDPTTSLNATRMSMDKTLKKMPFDKMKEIIALNKEVYYLEH